MARTIEFIKKSEARIIMFLRTADKPMKRGSTISQKLEIDYIYMMKIFRDMFQKGWIKTHMYDKVIFFTLTEKAPIMAAEKRLLGEPQARLRT